MTVYQQQTLESELHDESEYPNEMQVAHSLYLRTYRSSSSEIFVDHELRYRACPTRYTDHRTLLSTHAQSETME